MRDADTWDRLARQFLTQTGGGPTPDGFVLAACCGLELHPRERRGAMLRGSHAYYDGTRPVREQRALVMECVARWILRRAGEPASRAAVRRVAGALTGTPRPLAKSVVAVNLAAAAVQSR